MRLPRYRVGQTFYSRFNETRTITAVRYSKKLEQYFYEYDYQATGLSYQPVGEIKKRGCGERAMQRWIAYQ